MIVGVRGLLEAIGPDWVYVQVGGVTLQIYVPASTIGQLGAPGSPVHLHTHLRFREEQPLLYGFTTASALALFLSTLSVSGVGPRLSLALLSGLGPDRLSEAITTGDLTALSSVTGVGRRIAGRIVLELKGKLELETSEEAPSAAASDDTEIIEALTALGYTATEARRAVANLAAVPGATLEDKIRLALQHFGA